MPTVIVSVDVPGNGGAMAGGLRLAVTSGGSPEAEIEMGEVRPPETMIVEVPALACLNVSALGDALMLKLGLLPEIDTVRSTVVVSVMLPLTPLMVIV